MTDDEAMKLESVYYASQYFEFAEWVEKKISEKGYKGVVLVMNPKARYVNVIYHLALNNKAVKQYERTIPLFMSKEDISEFVTDIILLPSAVRERLRYIKEKRNETQG